MSNVLQKETDWWTTMDLELERRGNEGNERGLASAEDWEALPTSGPSKRARSLSVLSLNSGTSLGRRLLSSLEEERLELSVLSIGSVSFLLRSARAHGTTKKKSSCFLLFRSTVRVGRTLLLKSRQGQTFSAGMFSFLSFFHIYLTQFTFAFCKFHILLFRSFSAYFEY